MECVIADTCIGGVAEASLCAEKFAREGVGVSLTVTPCWCYGSETMDMDPLLPKAVWGFNGTERPGAVYLAAVLARTIRRACPPSASMAATCRTRRKPTSRPMCGEKMLRFVRAGLAAATMRGKSYLSLGNVSMGIAGSAVNDDFFEHYLGMRVETVDMVEFIRRIEHNVLDQAEFQRDWRGPRPIAAKERTTIRRRPTVGGRKSTVWEWSVKMALIARDLMIGNPAWPSLGFGEEALGRNALAAGFQGQRPWTDYLPNGDFMEAMLCSSFDWNGIRQPFIFATENDSLNGVAMLCGHLLTCPRKSLPTCAPIGAPPPLKKPPDTP